MSKLYDRDYQFCDANGVPLASGILEFFVAGTSLGTTAVVYSNAERSTSLGNTVSLDAAGRPSSGGSPVDMYGDRTYDVRLKNAAGAPILTIENKRPYSPGEFPGRVRNLAALTAITGMADNDAYEVLGYTTEGDGGGGTFFWDASSTATVNGGTVFGADAGGTGRWLRQNDAPASIRHYGVLTGNSGSVNAARLQAAIDNEDALFIPSGTYNVSSTIRLKRNFRMFGESMLTSIFNVDGDVTGFAMDETADGALVRSIILDDFRIQKATQTATTTVYGLYLVGTTNNVWGCKITNISIVNFYDGLRIARPILTEIDNVDCNNCVNDGVRISGSGTSIILNNVYSRENGGNGFHITGSIQYMSLQTCAADLNTLNGYYFAPSGSAFQTGVSISGCGAESNTLSGFKIEESENFVIQGGYSWQNDGDGIEIVGARGVVLTAMRSQSNTGYGLSTASSATPKSPSTITTIGTTLDLSNTAGALSDSTNSVAILHSPDSNTFNINRRVNARLGFSVNDGPTWTAGTGSPESAVTAPVGSLFSRTDGGTGTSLYVKESGSGNTGWVAK